VDIILKEVETILGRKTAVKGKNVVEYRGQTSLDSKQMMTTIAIALEQDAGITLVQTWKISVLRAFLSKLGVKNESTPNPAMMTGSISA